ncbi:hypothetical protein O7606_21570 [Micromonospora sp. WMMD882]|uniref:hypothetical protein n=1 Tax=Micromonospora sp. WMMD882 TaxID=3015151 RepID=UPI00248CF5ED|nr:hypothetical protein [Micromonospora sp. WMMD882]WBB78774.1 hypothetical protein O7606_21570 [Micromonospora sp. WMMD882]
MTWNPGPPPPPGPGHLGGRAPSGLFPSGRPARPTYREPHPITGGAVAVGGATAAAWLAFFGLLGADLRGYLWWTAAAGTAAWLGALALVRYGDRGVGTGVAIVTAGGWSIAAAVLASRWAATGDWPLW